MLQASVFASLPFYLYSYRYQIKLNQRNIQFVTEKLDPDPAFEKQPLIQVRPSRNNLIQIRSSWKTGSGPTFERKKPGPYPSLDKNPDRDPTQFLVNTIYILILYYNFEQQILKKVQFQRDIKPQCSDRIQPNHPDPAAFSCLSHQRQRVCICS